MLSRAFQNWFSDIILSLPYGGSGLSIPVSSGCGLHLKHVFCAL